MKNLTEEIVKTNEYFQTGKYVPAAVNPDIKLPNCTTFCMCAWHWVMNATHSYKLMEGRDPAGFGHAKSWYDKYLFDKGATPKVGSIACWDGTYGHVAFVKSFKKGSTDNSWSITVYQSNYGGALFEQRTYNVIVGQPTAGVTNGNFLGFCYHPYLKATESRKTNSEVAQEILDGKWGNGDVRKKKLTEAGYNYDTVQRIVNALIFLRDHPKKSNLEVAQEVARGEWGSGQELLDRLKQGGYNHFIIERLAQKILIKEKLNNGKK